MDKINFTGGFLLKKPLPPEVWEKTYNEIIPHKRVIINDIPNIGDIFVASKRCYDNEIGLYLLNKKINFEYYPKIDLKTRLDSYYPEEAKSVLQEQKTVIRGETSLTKMFQLHKKMKTAIAKYKWKKNDHIKKTYEALELSSEDYTHTIKKNVTIITDKDGNLIAKASPNTNTGTNYVLVYPKPKNHVDPFRMVIIDYEGKKTMDSTNIEDLKGFTKGFKKAIEIDRARNK